MEPGDVFPLVECFIMHKALCSILTLKSKHSGGRKQEDEKFKGILCHIESLRLARDTWNAKGVYHHTQLKINKILRKNKTQKTGFFQKDLYTTHISLSFS